MNELLIAREVAAILRVKPTTVYALVARDALPHIRFAQGRRRALIRFRRADVEAFLECHSVVPSSDTVQPETNNGQDHE